MDTELSTWKDDPSALVFVQSIGPVGRDKAGSTVSWDNVGTDLEALGGSRLYFNALNSATSNQYAQVGLGGDSSGYPSPTTQVASSERSGTGRLTGLLARSSSSGFYPDESRQPLQPLDGTLPGLLAAPPTPWPTSDPASQVVDVCIAGQLIPALSGTVESYFVSDTNLSWGEIEQQISSMTGCGGASTILFQQVQGDLKTEIDYLQTVEKWINNLKSPFTRDPSAGVSAIAQHINDDQVGTGSSARDVGVSWTSLTSDLLWIVSAIPPFDEIGNELNVLAGGFGVAADWADASNGSSQLADITESAADFASQLSTQYTEALGGFDHSEAIILSDYGMLKTAALNADNSSDPGKTYDWAWSLSNPDSYTNATNALTVAAARNSYETLFPDKYRLYRAQAGTGTLLANDITPYTCVSYQSGLSGQAPLERDWRPFQSTQRFGGAAPIVSAQGSTPQAGAGSVNGTVEQWVYAGDGDGFLSWTDPTKNPPSPPAVLPAEPLLSSMFATAQNGVSSLFNTLQFAVEAYHNGTTRAEVVTHQNKEADVLHQTSQYCATSGRTSP